MKPYDVAIIGGGVLGCFAARSMMQYRLSVVLIEGAEDVCTGITRTNTAVVYSGYDHHPGSLKADLTARANASFDTLCRELDVPFSRCGSLMTACGPRGEKILRRKLENGRQIGIPDLRLLTGDEARGLEPMLSPEVTLALYSGTTGTVNPWQLGIAAYENALANGLVSRLGAKVIGITKEDSGYRICTEREEITASTVVNCAGTGAVKIQEMLYPSPVQLRLDGSDFLVFDPGTPHPSHVVLEETESGKGITAVPCIEGNLLLDSPQRPYRPDNATTAEGLETIREHASRLLPELDLGGVIRSFGGVRPNPEYADGRSVKDFCIERPAVNLWSLIGIKTPGLTCACELGSYIAAQCAELLGAGRNDAFTPYRSAIRAQDGSPILCQCQQITRDEVLEAIRRGAVNIDGVKRRLGTGMGRCQGSRCAFEISRLLTEQGRDGSI